jgi:pyruvate formate lyase activating enzyme
MIPTGKHPVSRRAALFFPGFWLALTAALCLFWGGGYASRFLLSINTTSSSFVHDALFWTRRCRGVLCQLCPKQCFLPEGAKGQCRVRINSGGYLHTLVYGRAAAVHVDPIEKKPIFHLLPGSKAFSIATAGCNLNCDFCQNWTLSQANPEQLPADYLAPEAAVQAALQSRSRSIAYTYSEPVVFYEYMLETARLAHQAGLYNIMISAGYIQPEPLKRLLPYLDVIKIDLKGFDPRYYRTVVGGELSPVLRTLKIIANSHVQLEVVNLMVPSWNDSAPQVRALAQWVRDELGPETPLFFSRFSPGFRMLNLPATPAETLRQARRLALAEGLRFVYVGNVTGDEGENTNCPQCGQLLIHREGFVVLENHLRAGHCPHCDAKIPGIWK